MPRVQLEGYECSRCGHRWVKREATEGDPIICPKCKSPYWDKPRKFAVQQPRATQPRAKKQFVKRGV
ncbi:MAG: hypothetical protein ACREBU_07130 [Nitrososphaera sp.]